MMFSNFAEHNSLCGHQKMTTELQNKFDNNFRLPVTHLSDSKASIKTKCNPRKSYHNNRSVNGKQNKNFDKTLHSALSKGPQISKRKKPTSKCYWFLDLVNLSMQRIIKTSEKEGTSKNSSENWKNNMQG